MQSVFVSFSGREITDKDFAKRLLVRIEDQELDVWIYESRESEILPCILIDEFCKLKISQSDYFIAIVSDSSLQSENTRTEVDFGIQCHGSTGVLQIVTTKQPYGCWCEPYRSLASYKQVLVKETSNTDLERCIEDICSWSGVLYKAPKGSLPRLPLLSRLTDEMRRALPGDPQYETGLFSSLRQYAMDVADAYQERRFEHALSALDVLLYHLKRDFGGNIFYYPRIVRGILLAELGRQTSTYLLEANETFQNIINDNALHGKMDENALAGLAAVEMLQGHSRKALDHYRSAHNIVVARGQSDPDLLHNLILAIIASGAYLSMREVEQLTEFRGKAFLTKEPFLVERFAALAALARTYIGDVVGSEEALATVDWSSSNASDILIRLTQELAEQNLQPKGLIDGFFQLILKTLSDDKALLTTSLSYASFLYQHGRFVDALNILGPLMDMYKNDPKILIDAFWCCFQLKRCAEAQTLAERAVKISIIDDNTLSSENTRNHFYYRGFANWLLGSYQIAESDFRDSAFANQFRYDHVALRHGFFDK